MQAVDVRALLRSIGANLISNALWLILLPLGAAMISLFKAFLHSIELWKQYEIGLLLLLAVIAWPVIIYFAIKTRKTAGPEQAKQLHKQGFGIPQLAEGIRNYARTRKAAKHTQYVLFDKPTLSDVLGDERGQFDAVMEYLQKSGRATKHPNMQGYWFID